MSKSTDADAGSRPRSLTKYLKASAVCAAEAFCLPSAAALTRSAFLFDTGGVSGAYADREKREEGERVYGGVSAGGTVFYGS